MVRLGYEAPDVADSELVEGETQVRPRSSAGLRIEGEARQINCVADDLELHASPEQPLTGIPAAGHAVREVNAAEPF